ncbi:unnamed protein product [Blepharisma stoltei]|uniref:Uncharacterized protein n=1 Tax=Blepharisma stoltei TaxID=1481888 RepID=A0AAU9IWW3_9CILI|nr:unnamed protein product [Blepharisma stoltei]
MTEKSELNRIHEQYLLEKLLKNHESIQCIQNIMKRPNKDPSFSYDELNKHGNKNYLILYYKKKQIEPVSYMSEAELYRDYQVSMSKRIAMEIPNLTNSIILKESIFNKVKLMHDKNLLYCLKETLSNNAKAILSEIILFSRDSTEFDISASNAITILNYTSHFIKMKDFHGIRIPEADLSQCSLANVNFENSFLKGANLSNTFFYCSNLQNCNLEDTYFEQKRPMLLKNSLYKSEITISSSGKYIAYIESSKSRRKLGIAIRNIITQEIITEINIDSAYKHAFEFSADEKYLAIGSDIDLKLIDLNNGQISMSTMKDSEKLDFLKFSFNSNHIALASSKIIYLWSVNSKLILVNIIREASLIKNLLYSKLSNFMILIAEASIKFYDLFGYRCMRAISGNFENITSINLSPCEKYFILFVKAELKIINIENFEIKFNKKFDAPLFVSISPYGQFLSLSNCSKSKIFNLESQIFLNEFKCHEKKAKRVIFSPRGGFYLMANDDYCLKFFNYDDNIESHKFYEKKIYSISFSSHQKKHYLAISRSDSCIIWDLDSYSPVSNTPDFYFSSQVLFMLSGKFLKLWNPTTQNKTNYRFNDEINKIGISPSGKYAAIAYGGQTVEIKDLELDMTLITWNSRFDDICISSSPCGQYFAIAVYNKNANGFHPLPKKIVIWEIRTKKKEFELPIKDFDIRALACSPYGQYLTFGYEGKLNFWDIKKGKELFCLFGHKAKISSAAFSFSGAFLASGSEDRSIILWAIEENSQVTKIAQVLAHSSSILSITFSLCNKYFISLGLYGEIFVWKIKRNLSGKDITLNWSNKNFQGASVFSTNFNNCKLSPENKNFIDFANKWNSQLEIDGSYI